MPMAIFPPVVRGLFVVGLGTVVVGDVLVSVEDMPAVVDTLVPG